MLDDSNIKFVQREINIKAKLQKKTQEFVSWINVLD